MDLLKETMDSGVKPLELTYQAVINTKLSKIAAYRSTLQINSVDLGVLLPEQYLAVASRTNQCVELALFNLEKLYEDVISLEKKSISFEWLSLFIPVRMLLKTDISAKLKKIAQCKGAADYSKICLEFPMELLYENREDVNKALVKLKKCGLRLTLRDLGLEYCPIFRLNGLLVDSVIVGSEENGDSDLREDAGVRSTIGYARDLGFEVISEGVDNDDQMLYLYRLDCLGAVGKISGRRKRIGTILMKQVD